MTTQATLSPLESNASLKNNNKHNQYRITIEEVSTKADRELQTLTFEIEDREDMFEIIKKMKQGSGLDEQSATRLGLSIRLLGPMMMQDRKHPLFADFMPHFKEFMQNLKKTIKDQIKGH